MSMDVLIAGGGTGGHLFPGIAVAQEIRRREPGAKILFVGSPRGIEVGAVPKAGFDLELLPISGLRRVGVLGLARGMARLPWAVLKAVALVRRVRPDVAVSVGGYAAGPAVLAARLCGVPCAVMEQNAIAGLTNRVLSRFADRVFAAMPPKGIDPDKVSVFGNPVRADLHAVRQQAYAPHDPKRLLVFGGSQGARALNDAMLAWMPKLAAGTPALAITHQTGRDDHERVAQAYRAAGVTAEVTPFIDDMASAYREADLVICRSGATSIAELTMCGRPSLLVPYPFAVDDHQTRNAAALANKGAALLLPQPELSADRLHAEVTALVHDPARLAQMAAAARASGHPSAAQQITDALYRLGGQEAS
jgi:UDP-N-acetylglucosamine--N-acetylmuramyl-(pentapeptide) pyrophosphoryl-undecaprenol N-acetylglucosamine transferase